MAAVALRKEDASFHEFFGQASGSLLRPHELREYLFKYQKLVPVALEALGALERGNIPDPTVGENACQLRAWKFAEFFNSANFEQALEQSICNLKRAQPAIETAIETVRMASFKEWHPLDRFLETFRCQISLDERVYQLISAHFITLAWKPVRSFQKTESDGVQPREVIEENNALQRHFGHDKTARKVAKVAKKYLARASILALQEAAEYHQKELPDQLRILTNSVRETTQELMTAPCFSSAEVILADTIEKRIPIVVKIHQVDRETTKIAGSVTLFYVSNGFDYVLSSRKTVSQTKAWIMIEAASIANPIIKADEIVSRMEKAGLKKIFLAYMASHPVYGGDLHEEKGPHEEARRRTEFIENAVVLGCCKENPELCRIYHIYPMTTKAFQEASSL